MSSNLNLDYYYSTEAEQSSSLGPIPPHKPYGAPFRLWKKHSLNLTYLTAHWMIDNHFP